MEQQDNDLFEKIEVLLRRKWLLILPIIMGAGLAAYVSLKLPEFYRSTTLILVEQQKIPQTYVTPTDSTPFEQRLSTIKQQVMSRTNLEKIIEDFNLYAGEGKRGLRNLLKKLELDDFVSSFIDLDDMAPSKEEIIEMMRDDIDVDVMGRSGGGGGDAFRISYVGGDPYITMQVTNTLASLFIEENLKIKEQYAEGTSEFLSKELESAKEELEAQERGLRRFKERHMGALPEQLDANLRTLDRLQLELQSVNEALKNAEDREIWLEEQIKIASERTVSAQHAGASETVNSSLGAQTSLNPYDELQRLKNRLNALLSVYKETYPDVIIVKKRIKELEKRLAKESTIEGNGDEPSAEPTMVAAPMDPAIQADLTSLKSRVETLKEREMKIRRQIKDFERRVEATPANEQRLADLQRNYDMTFENYQRLLEKKLNARLAENLEKKQKGSRFRVLDPANLPEKPFKPNRKMITAMGGAAGAGFGLGLVFLLEFLNPAFRKPEDFSGVLDKPVLAAIPTFSAKTKKLSSKKKGLRVVKGARGKGA